jgi:hypothetical protein
MNVDEMHEIGVRGVRSLIVITGNFSNRALWMDLTNEKEQGEILINLKDSDKVLNSNATWLNWQIQVIQSPPNRLSRCHVT